MALIVTALGTLGAITLPLADITDFLYLIGSVFAPMIAVIIANYFVLKRDDMATSFNWPNLVIWVCGFILYRQFMVIDTPLGSTFPVMIIVFAATCAVGLIARKATANK